MTAPDADLHENELKIYINLNDGSRQAEDLVYFMSLGPVGLVRLGKDFVYTTGQAAAVPHLPPSLYTCGPQNTFRLVDPLARPHLGLAQVHPCHTNI